jgi:putative DNA primase/helicase
MTTAAAVMVPEKYQAFSGFGKRFCKSNLSKMPMQANGTPAKSNDSTTWADYGEAVNSLRANEFLGVFLGGGDDVPAGKAFCCVDLDHCRNNGEWSEWASDIVERASTYTEVSMSGSGLHIFGFCDSDIKSHKRNGLEIYTGLRFIAVTGNQEFGTFGFSDITGLINELIDNEFTTDTPAATIDNVKPTIPTGGGEWERAEYIVNSIYDKVNSYADYFTVGGALASTFGERGAELFEKFSENPNYNDSREKVRRDYEGFLSGARGRSGGSVYGMGTLVYIGKKYGVTIPLNLREWHDSRPATDAENARVLVQGLTGEWLHNFEAREWFYYDNETGLWKEDTTTQIYNKVAEIVQGIKLDTVKNPTANTNNILKKCIALESTARIKAALTLAAAALPAKYSDFDTDINIIGVKNGALNLQTFELLPKNPGNMLTASLGTEFIPGAKCPKFLDYLEFAQPNKEMRDFLQRLVGVTLAGGNPETIFPFHYGQGKNGKSVFANVKAGIFKEYSKKISVDAFMRNNNGSDRAKNEFFRARAARMVWASEPAKNLVLDEGTIKDITGGEVIQARALYQESIEYKPLFIPELIGNNKPLIKTADFGTWRRVLIIPWNVLIPPEKRIPINLFTAELLTESAGILNWYLDGLKDYTRNGLNVPGSIIDAVNEYKTDSDLISEFISSEIEFFAPGGGVSISVPDAYMEFQKWLQETGSEDDYKATQRKFSTELKARGYELTKMNNNSRTLIWHGAQFRNIF